MISRCAGKSLARRTDRWSRSSAGASPHTPRRCVLAPVAAARVRVAARIPVRSRRDRRPPPSQTRRAGDESRPVDRARRPAACGRRAAARSQARQASVNASGHAPCSCMISARCTRQVPVNATISRLLLAHARKRGGPFASAPQGIDLPAGVDHAAVHQPRHDRKQLTRDDGEHRLVQALETGRRRRPAG